MPSFAKQVLPVCARSSKLSLAQVQEVLKELHTFHPSITFDVMSVLTKGDKDLKTSLRLMDKTDFFTQEIDRLLLDKKCRIAVHSAKDLPEPLPAGLAIVALTKGISSADVLVFRDGEGLTSCGRIGVSSERREAAILKMQKNLTCIEVRGPIEKRLELLDEQKEIDGLVVAEAALLRLGIKRKSQIHLKAQVAPLQGRLAVVAHAEDEEMRALFACIDAREKIIK